MRALHVLAAAIALIGASGCASYRPTPLLAKVDPNRGYRYENLNQRPPGAEKLFVIVTMSGGGTRAAAFSYGVLDKLRRAKLPDGRSLLSEVDVISSVSGGSFTAAYYTAFGEQKFFDHFRADVLYRRMQHDLWLQVLSPWNWPRLWSFNFGRGDLADEYYDRAIFHGLRFKDLPRRPPFLILNATDMSLGAQFSFIQDDFDRMCADLDEMPLSQAVTASSAFPVGFTPLTLDNHARPTAASACGYEEPEWVGTALRGDFDKTPSRWARAKVWRSYEDGGRRPFVHLYDGGLADNIGLRGPEIAIETSDVDWNLIDMAQRKEVDRLVVIVVDAKPGGESPLDRTPAHPWVTDVLQASATNPMENYSAETVEAVRKQFREWDNARADYRMARRACRDLGPRDAAWRKRCYEAFSASDADAPAHPELYRIHVRFEAVADAELRARLQSIPTALELSSADVDRLIDAAGALLDRSADYQRLLRDLGAREEAH